MNEIENKIFNCIVKDNTYYYSSDMTVRAEEQAAIKILKTKDLLK